EHLANITLVARLLGGEKVLTPTQVGRIAEIQRASGAKLPPLACKTCSEGVCPTGESASGNYGLSHPAARSSTAFDEGDSERMVAEIVQALKKELTEL
ncbi:MAG: hypothetical protein JW941_00835, partial [Candidatus Coatesbacteria bacterium]|nr:hypothetical protein [Candidatus Coatesbacteria bacterium]